MLKGFSVPLTPQGKSTLAPLPPWHYSSDCIAIEYWADPAAIAALLPPGLAPDTNQARLAEGPLGSVPGRHGAPDDQIVISVQEVPPSQAMEMAQIMPDVSDQ